jgi:2-C-methyl-D-erythritol 4-phosphate cytidylyltransferase/2-C-methyl-D-erythritol 2,4-cyclodiphosphate synthase
MATGRKKTNHAIILAAGRGSRLGGTVPKQFQLVQNYPLLHYSLATFLNHKTIGSVTVVLPEDFLDFPLPSHRKLRPPVAGGSERYLSTIRALDALCAAKNDGVLIHDAARPLVPESLITAVCNALDDADLVTPTLPINDAIMDSENLFVVDRAHYSTLQTPQGFRCSLLRKSMEQLKGKDMTQWKMPSCEFEVARVFFPSAKVKVVAGHPQNYKITNPHDKKQMELLLAQ